MVFFFIALFLVGTVAILEYFTGQKRHYTNYLTWFLIVWAALYAGSIYGGEDFNPYHQYKIKNDDDTIEPPTFEELDDEGEEIDSDDEEEEIANDDESLLTKHGLKYGCDYTVKFVPDGTPSSFINDDDTLSKECLRIIKSTDKTIAHESFRLHKQHAHDYYKKAKEWCWYYPEVSKREKLKTIFLSAVATVPGTVRTKTISALLVFFAQYGIYCIDSYFDMEHNLHMSKYHFQMVDAYRKHIKNNGW